MAKKTSLKDAKDYIALTIAGQSKKDAALQVLGRNDPQTIRTMENSEAYQILINTMANNHKVALASQLQDIQTATLRAQSKLLEQGNQMMDEARSDDMEWRILPFTSFYLCDNNAINCVHYACSACKSACIHVIMRA